MSTTTTPAVADSSRIRVGFRTASFAPSRLRYIRQVGAQDVFIDHSSMDEEPAEFLDTTDTRDRLVLDGDVIPSVDALTHAKDQIEAAGLSFAGIQSLPYSLYGPIMFDRENADARIDLVIELIENLAEAGIPILGYQWNPRGLVPMRTGTESLRGGAEGTAFDLDALDDPFSLAETVDRPYEEAELWENYERFIERVVPVAEEHNVRMALHPVDPPGIEQIGGIPRLFRSVAAFERAMEIVPSEAHGLKLCLGCFSQIGEDIPALIRRFGERGQIVFVHFRDVVGTVPSFYETFADEGNYDAHEAMSALYDVGFSGTIIPDHVPHVEGDTEWGHRANGYTAGYFRGLIHAIERNAD